LKFGKIDVGGVVSLAGADTGGDIDVGGRFIVLGDISFKNLDVGGVADIRGTATGENINVGGILKVASNLKLSDDLDVGGSVDVKGTTEAKRVGGGGSLSGGSLIVEMADLSGTVKTERGILARRNVVVSRRCYVRGWIKSAESVVVESKAEADSIYAPRILMKRHSKASNLYAQTLQLEDDVEILGEALYTESVRFESSAGGLAKASKLPVKVDTLPHQIIWPESDPKGSAD